MNKIDANLNDCCERAFNVDAISLLWPDKQVLDRDRPAFEAGELECPELKYSLLTDEKMAAIVQAEQELLLVRAELRSPKEIVKIMSGGWRSLTEASVELVMRLLYLWKINLMLAQFRLVKAAKAGQYQRMRRYSVFIYGKPNQRMLRATAAEIREQVKEALAKDPDNNRLQIAAERLLEFFKNIPEDSTYAPPTQEVLERLSAIVYKHFGKVIDWYESMYGRENCKLPRDAHNDLKEFDQVEILGMYVVAAWLLGLDTKGWAPEISSRGQVWTNQTRKRWLVPESHALPRKANTLIGDLLHEEGVHALRRENAAEGPLIILEKGLDRYFTGEEGLGLAVEIGYEGRFDGYGLPGGPMGICLGLGLDGTPRGYRGVYEFHLAFGTFLRASKGVPDEEGAKVSRNIAWDNAARTFLGGDGAPGNVFTRDFIYREGSLGLWETFASHPEELGRMLKGKYDLANERHRWALDILGIG